MTADNPGANGFSIIVVDPDAFCGRAAFRGLVDRLCAYQMSSAPRPGHTEVVVPGLYDFRTREKRLAAGIPVAEAVWELVMAAGKEVGVTVPPEETP
jgi:LDH2 family malate/lactate/ureidoglycolate dehydrogenase